MVTHIPPPSPSLSSASLSNASQSTSRRVVRPPPSRNAFPPSPPSSYNYAESVAPYAPSNASASAQHRRSTSGEKAASVASTSAARRPSHRSSRRSRRSDDFDGAAEIPTNAFPWFSQSGDVEIRLRDRAGRAREKRYLLHRLLLAQNSTWFAREFEGVLQNPADRSRSSSFSHRHEDGSDGSEGLWRYELSWSNEDPGSLDSIPMLRRVNDRLGVSEFRERSRPPPANASFFSNLTSRHASSRRTSVTTLLDSSDALQRDLDVIDAYENMFLSFYNHTPDLDALNIATAYVKCKTLLQVAERYSSVDIVGPRCDHHLLRYQGRLWKQVAKYPSSYLRLGYMAHSNAIFREALIHVVGQWPIPRKQLSRGSSPGFDRVIDLIEDKAEELGEARAKAESRLFRLSLTTSRGERVGPMNSWNDWLAVSLFRQWLADHTNPTHGSILKDSSARSEQSAPTPLAVGRTFRLMAAGGEAYLSHDDLKKFLKKTPSDYSRDGLRKFERRMDELKNLARDIVKPLTRSFLELDAEGEGMPYLTCSRVEEGDLRWVWKL